MPFIRYKTGDIAVNSNQKCKCGRGYKLIQKVEGRMQEYIYKIDGSKGVLTGLYKIFDDVKEAVSEGQFYQDQIGFLEVRVVKTENFTENHRQYIIQKIKEKYGNSIEISIVFVDKIPRTARGKYKFMIQRLSL